MESKKGSMFASLMEDDSDGPGAASFGPLSPFRDDLSMGSGAVIASGSSPSQASQQSSLSCVTKATFQEDCARHRFIVWAAIKRNSSRHMPSEKKLECPLLKCIQRFPDHESMLKHLPNCTYLASGEYWCYDHMRVERFDDLKCKRCLGHPSKRKRMLTMAKSFFHSLGQKSKKGNSPGIDNDDNLSPPPPYDSVFLPPSNSIELSSTEIVEIDSREVASIPQPPVMGFDGAINPQDLLVPLTPSPPELDSVTLAGNPFIQWQPTQPAPFMPEHSFPIGFPEDFGRNPSARPALQVTTHGLPARRHAAPRPAPTVPRSKILSPSSSVRSTASTDTTASVDTIATTSSNVSSLVSPSSNWSGAWSMPSGVNTNLTSPIEEFGPFTDHYSNVCPDLTGIHTYFHELPADIPDQPQDDIPSDPLIPFPNPDPVDMLFVNDTAMAEQSTNMVELDEPELSENNVCCSETKSVVGSAWDALQEHLLSSTLKIQHVNGNHLADQLKSMSTKTIATSGLRVLRALLEGVQPTSAIDTLCFVHLTYAFSLAVHENGASNRSKQFFSQSLSYANSLPLNERTAYMQLACCIWQPGDVGQAEIGSYFAMSPVTSLSRSSSLKGKEREESSHFGDSLLAAARDFLDELEMSLVLGQIPSSPEVQASELYVKHLQELNPVRSVNVAFTTTVEWVLKMLIDKHCDVGGLENKLLDVCQRVGDGTISSVRKAEIEMLHAGKESMFGMRFFDSYTPEVRSLCDQIYTKHDAGTSRRNAYHQAGISLIEKLIPEFDKVTGEPLAEENSDLDDLINSIDMEGVIDTRFPFTLNLMGESVKTLQLPTLVTTPADSPENATDKQEQHQEGESAEQQAQQQKVEADACCEICGYRPKGDPQWFKGSMAKHKKLQHSTEPPKIFKCPFPGCTSQYKNRPDNLRQHQIEKNHWVKGDEGTSRRPSKRKKVESDE